MNANIRTLLAATAAFAKTKKLLAMTCAAAFSLGATAATYTSADYAQREHLLIQWDGIDNAGTWASQSSPIGLDRAFGAAEWQSRMNLLSF